MSHKTLRWNAPRKIIHVDMDAFYAGIEQRDRPELRGKPVVGGGNPEGRGVVSTASYEARKFGIHSAMPAAQAKRLCPQAIFLRPNFEKYETVSQKIRSILHNYTDLIQPLALDEAYLDVTQNKLRIDDPVKLAQMIKQHIVALTQLTASAGVAPNKFLAKVASEMEKPNGLTVIHPDEAQVILHPLPVRKIPGVGPVTEEKLHQLGIKTCADLFSKTQEELIRHFGKFGLDLYEMARGIDESPVESAMAPKQIGSEETFERDLLDFKLMEEKIRELTESVVSRLEQEVMRGKTVTLKVKYEDFTQITRSKTLSQPTQTGHVIAEEAMLLLKNKTEAGRRKIRLLGVSVSGFEMRKKQEAQSPQPDLFQ